MESFTIIIEYKTVKYGLVILPSFTIRQVKQAISDNLDIVVSNQVLAYNSVILDNDKTVGYYGIRESSQLVLIENAFQDNLVNKDTGLIELNSWLDFLNTDFEAGSGFIRDVDYITNKIHETETIPYSLDCVDNALTYIAKCAERAGKLYALASELSQKYLFLQNECNRFHGIMEGFKMEQLNVAHGNMKRLNLHAGTEQEVHQLRSQSQSSAPSQSSPSQPHPTMRNAIEEYLWWLNNEKEDTPSKSTCASQQCLSPTPSMASMISTVNPNGRDSMASLKSMITTCDQECDQECDQDCDPGEELKPESLLHLPMYHADYFVPAKEEESGTETAESRVVSVHTKEGALSILELIKNHPNNYTKVRVLDFSYASLGNDGFTQLISTFTNCNIPITELHLAGNQLTCNQIIFLIHQVRVPYRQSNPDFCNSVFPKLRLLDLNDNQLGNEGVKQLFTLLRYRCYPDLQQVFLLNNNLTTEVTSSLINVTLHEKNEVNLVIPETQLALLTEEDRGTLLKLYQRIEKKAAVCVDLDHPSSLLFVQLYLLTICSALVNCVERFAFKNVFITDETLAVILSILHRYVLYDRCQRVVSFSFINCKLGDPQLSAICKLLNEMARHGAKKLSFFGFDENEITAEGVKELVALCDALNAQFSVASGSAGRGSGVENPIGHDGFQYYLSHFFDRHFASIDAIDFHGCCLTTASVSALLQALESKQKEGVTLSICALNLSDNALGDEAVDDLQKVFSLLPSLRNVYLDHTELSSSGVYSVISYFIKHKPASILFISIRCNNMDDVECANMKEVIKAGISSTDTILIDLDCCVCWHNGHCLSRTMIHAWRGIIFINSKFINNRLNMR